MLTTMNSSAMPRHHHKGSHGPEDHYSVSMMTKETASDSFSTQSSQEQDEDDYYEESSSGDYDSSSSEDCSSTGYSSIVDLMPDRVGGAGMLKRSESNTRLKLSNEARNSGPRTPPRRQAPVRIASCDHIDCDVRPHTLTEEEETLIHWVVELLKEHLQRIVAHRVIMTADHSESDEKPQPPDFGEFIASALARSMQNKGMARGRPRFGIIDQMVEVIEFPKPAAEQHLLLDPQAYKRVELSDEVQEQLTDFVREIARMYHAENPFHNFEHACNVTLAASKFLNRMVTEQGPNAQHSTDNTFGIATDPLTLFACVFAALIHDTDHEGVPSKYMIQYRLVY